MAELRSSWAAAQSAADEYARFAMEIERIRRDTKLFKQGLIPLEAVSPSPARVQARLKREIAHEQWLRLSPAEARLNAQERMIGGQLDLQEACLLEKLVKFSRAVGRVVLPAGQGLGTGWLIDEGLLLTNHHVLPNRGIAQGTSVMMGYERSAEGKPQNGQTFNLRPDLFYLTPRETASGEEEVDLDFALVAVESRSQEGKLLADYGFVTLDGAGGKVIESENCMVIQHPQGDYKKITLRDNRLLLVTDQPGADKHVFYESDTLQGSSGALVVGLGTGEAIALHRAGVPRRDAQGRMLRKDGKPWQRGDSDSDVDWVANQGVRVSRLVDFISQAEVAPAMRARKEQLVAAMQRKESAAQTLMNNSGEPEPRTSVPAFVPPSAPPDARPDPAAVPPSGPNGSGGQVEFMVRVSTRPLIREQIMAAIQRQMVGTQVEELIPAEVPSYLRAYLVVKVPGVTNPWATAAQLESLDGVEEAEPDLPRYLATNPDDLAAEAPALFSPRAWESSSGPDRWNEAQFLSTWQHSSPWVSTLNPQAPDYRAQVRRWNQRAVGFDAARVAGLLGAAGLRALADLRLAQLDTGYTDHSKVREGYNFDADYDAIDRDDDARDPLHAGFNKFPGHGTRTGSLLIGTDASHVVAGHEGNAGLLHGLSLNGLSVRVRLAPFRVAESVVLLGSVKEVSRAGPDDSLLVDGAGQVPEHSVAQRTHAHG